MQNSHKLAKCPHILHSIPVPAKCWAQIGIDIISPFRESNNKEYIVTCVDYFSKYVEAKSVENKTGSAVGAFIYDLICQYSVMDITITDQGTFYTNLISFNKSHFAGRLFKIEMKFLIK